MLTNKTMGKKVYYPYIDTAKGLGVFCVLTAHMGWVVGYTDALFSQIIRPFFLGILFIASGCMSAKLWELTIGWKSLFSGKNFKILIPFFVVGLSFVLINDLALTGRISKNPFDRLLFQPYNGGYWYLLSLFVYRLFAILSRIITQHYMPPKYVGGGNVFIMIVIAVVFYSIFNVFGISIMLQYLGFYIIGILIFHYSLQNSLLCKDSFVAAMLLGAVMIFIVNYFGEFHYPGKSVLIGIVSSIAVFSVLMRTKGTPIVRFFRWIGGFSLDVYVLHYFFILGSEHLIDREWFVGTSWLVQTIVMISGAMILLGCSYVLSKIIRSNSILAKCILGK